MYKPCHNFQICTFHDGNVYYDKIKRLGLKQTPGKNGKSAKYSVFSSSNDDNDEEKQNV